MTHWALVVATATAAWLAGKPWVWGIVIGGGAIGLLTLIHAGALTVMLRRGSTRLAVLIVAVKFAASLGLAWLALSAGDLRPDPVGFALGLTCLPVAVVCEALRARRT
jgi:predicted permease